ncbi:EI24 domain-containing protein [Baaleninema simplex]|uniref:EI24 domain-containing protein n=1 Tax=Baaleninema simplex TaxID=2862350 RepID=UPI00034DAECB|nr:EI24 domain-containing protein [Baaleninema simplex]
MTDERGENWFSRILNVPVGAVAGATYPLRAIALLLAKPKLLGYVVFPILTNIVVGIALYVGLLLPGLRDVRDLTGAIDSRIATWVANLPAWLSWLGFTGDVLGGLLQILLVLGLFVLTGFLLVQFGVILGSPWYGQLSEQLEKLKTGKLPTYEGGALAIVKDIWRALAFEVKKLVLAAGLGVFLLILNFVPGIGTAIASLGGIGITATLVCLDFLDSPLERRRLRFRDKLKIAFSFFPATGTFSLVCLALVSVPLVNLLAVPVCVTAGTLFFCDRIYPKQFAAIEADRQEDFERSNV